MNLFPSLDSPCMATNASPGLTRRESYSNPETDGLPLRARISAPCKSCWKVIGMNYRAAELLDCTMALFRKGELAHASSFRGSTLELDHDASPSGYVSAGNRGLLVADSAAQGIEFQAALLRKFDGGPHGLSDKGRHHDPALFDIKHDRPAGRGRRLRFRCTLLLYSACRFHVALAHGSLHQGRPLRRLLYWIRWR